MHLCSSAVCVRARVDHCCSSASAGSLTTQLLMLAGEKPAGGVVMVYNSKDISCCFLLFYFLGATSFSLQPLNSQAVPVELLSGTACAGQLPAVKGSKWKKSICDNLPYYCKVYKEPLEVENVLPVL